MIGIAARVLKSIKCNPAGFRGIIHPERSRGTFSRDIFLLKHEIDSCPILAAALATPAAHLNSNIWPTSWPTRLEGRYGTERRRFDVEDAGEGRREALLRHHWRRAESGNRRASP